MKKTASKTIIVTTHMPANTISSQATKERVALIAQREFDNTRFEKKSSIMMVLEAALQSMAA